MNYGFDLYEVLEINKESSSEEIKKAYKRLALKYHPDRSTGDIEKFKQIALAYEILREPTKKRDYDKFKNRTSRERNSESNQNYEDSFQNSFQKFNRKNSQSNFNPFGLFQEIFGEFCNFVVNEQLGGPVSFQDWNVLKDIENFEKFYSSPLQFSGNMILEPIFSQINNSLNQSEFNLSDSFLFTNETSTSIHDAEENSAYSSSEVNRPSSEEVKIPIKKFTHKEMNQGNEFQKKKPIDQVENGNRENPKDLIQTIKVNLLDIYENKVKKFSLTRVRFKEGKGRYKEKKVVQIPLIHKQIKISEGGDFYPNWEKPGDLIINIIAKPHERYLRINDWDLMIYHKISLTEWYTGFTLLGLLDGKKLRIPLKASLSNCDFLIKIPGYGLPKTLQKTKLREHSGNLYVQIIIQPPRPGDMDTEDVPQLIRILGSVDSNNTSKDTNCVNQIEELSVDSIHQSDLTKLEVLNYDDTEDSE